jgi:hypothetical protein
MSNAELIEARDLILRPALGFDERVRLAALLRLHISDATIAENNLFQTSADRRFMARHFPGDSYQTAPIAAGRLARYGHTIASAVRGDYSSLAAEALAVAARRGIVDQIVTAVLPARTASTMSPGSAMGSMPAPATGTVPVPGSTMSQAQRDAIKREIRILTLARADLLPDDRNRLIKLLASHYRKGPVTQSNYVFVALNFLRAYFPADYQAEKERRGQRMAPAAPQQASIDQNPSQAHPRGAPFALYHPYPPVVAPPPVLTSRLTFVAPRPADGQPPPGSASAPVETHPALQPSRPGIEQQPSQYDEESGTDAVELE